MTPVNLDQLIHRDPKQEEDHWNIIIRFYNRKNKLMLSYLKYMYYPNPLPTPSILKVLDSHTFMAYRRRIRNSLLCAQFFPLCIPITGHLIGCGKKWKIMRKFSAILCGSDDYAEVSDDYAEKKPDYAEISKLKKLFPWLFQTNKKLINVLPRN